MNIATGAVLPDDMSLSFLTTKDTGEALMKDFLKNKLDSMTKFWDSLERADTKTFASLNKKVKCHQIKLVKEFWDQIGNHSVGYLLLQEKQILTLRMFYPMN